MSPVTSITIAIMWLIGITSDEFNNMKWKKTKNKKISPHLIDHSGPVVVSFLKVYISLH